MLETVTMDAKGAVLGRFATRVVSVLLGKDHPPSIQEKRYRRIVITNAQHVIVTGKKEVQKRYRRHSGYPGGFREEQLQSVRARKPAFILQHAIAGMLPKNRLGRRLMRQVTILVGKDQSG